MKKIIKNSITIYIGIVLGIFVSILMINADNNLYASNINIDKTNMATIQGNSLNDALKYLYDLSENIGVTCPSGQVCSQQSNFIKNLKVGDLVKMMLTKTSVRLSAEMTGYSGYDTDSVYLNPSELNLWRVIRKNDDGTVDMVSEYTSSREVVFYGVTGYANYVRYLNELASKYTNNQYVIRTRHMGYNRQVSVIKDTSAFDGTSNEDSWACSTGENCHPEKDEKLGGGDLLYQDDLDLVKNAYIGKSLNGVLYPVGTELGISITLKNSVDYFLASRNYLYIHDSFFYFTIRYFRYNDVVGHHGLINHEYDWNEGQLNLPIRPIVTLKYDAIDDGISLYKMPLYYAYGNPTTSSTTDYSTLKYTDSNEVEHQRDVFIGLYEDGSKGICMIRNNNLECFKYNNVTIEQEHVQSFFSDAQCTINDDYVECHDTSNECYIGNNGVVACHTSSSNCNSSLGCS